MKPLVLLHGFMGGPGTFDDVVGGLHQPTYALPLGDGVPSSLEGEADRLLETLSREGVHEFDLLGYSLGGRLAMHMAMKAPDRVHRLVLESAHPGMEEASERTARLDHDEQWAERLVDEWPDVLRAWYAQTVFASVADTPLLEAMIREKETRHPGVLARELKAWSLGLQKPKWSYLAHRTHPTLFISGEMDGRYQALGERLVALSGPIRHVSIRGAGHVVHREQPEAYLAALRSFL